MRPDRQALERIVKRLLTILHLRLVGGLRAFEARLVNEPAEADEPDVTIRS